MKIVKTLTSLNKNDLQTIKKTGTIEIPADIDAIGNEVFALNQNLKEIKLPVSLKSIGKYAFSHCINLKKVVFNSVVSIEDEAFSSCANLDEIIVSTDVVLKLKNNIKNYTTYLDKHLHPSCKIAVEKVQPCFNTKTSKIDFFDYIDNEGNTY